MSLCRWILSMALLICLAPLSFAQTNDWAIVRQLVPGQKVKVETNDGKSHVGKVRSTSEDALVLEKDQSLQKLNVQQVWLWSSGHRGRNTLIGLGVGAGAGIVIGEASCGGNDSIVPKGECVAVGIPLLGAIGAGTGALLPSRGKWREVYRSK